MQCTAQYVKILQTWTKHLYCFAIKCFKLDLCVILHNKITKYKFFLGTGLDTEKIETCSFLSLRYRFYQENIRENDQSQHFI